jgi:GH25 family lysozyme M1 (1,4-beta-N-acetylmuramidase)
MTPAPYRPPVMADVVFGTSHRTALHPSAATALAAAEAGGMMAHVMKATQGSERSALVDPTFVAGAAATPTAGLLPGAYHYFDASDPGAQAVLFLNIAASLPKLALDFEPDPASEKMQNNAAVFVQLVYQATGE